MAMALSATAICAQNEGPTMGWSSWNTFGLNINETLIKQTANSMVSKKLLDAGCQPGRLQGFYARLKKKKK